MEENSRLPQEVAGDPHRNNNRGAAQDTSRKRNCELRMTKQRKVVYELLLKERDHPTAQTIFERAQKKLPGVSLATIYNCLEALSSHNVIQQVNISREPTRYCANLIEHGHFHDQKTGAVHDLKLKQNVNLHDIFELPEGAVVQSLELNVSGSL